MAAACRHAFDLAATKLDQETAGFILGKDAYRDADLSQQQPEPGGLSQRESRA